MIYDVFLAPFVEFDFMRRALFGVCALALGSGPVGVFLMLRRMSLTGDVMAHAILPGAAAGYLLYGLSLPAMTIGGLFAGCTVALLAGLVSRVTKANEDASLAAFYLISLALGVTIVSVKGSNIDLLHVLFGSVLALDDGLVLFMASVSTFSLILLALIFRPLVLDCADPGFLAAVSPLSRLVHFIFLGLVALNLVAGFHALGTLLAVGLMMLPAATARFWCTNLSPMIILSVLAGVLSGFTGLLLSYHISLPTGPSIVLISGCLYILSVIFGRRGSVLSVISRAPHFER